MDPPFLLAQSDNPIDRNIRRTRTRLYDLRWIMTKHSSGGRVNERHEALSGFDHAARPFMDSWIAAAYNT
jgi:hypothetical protein